MQPGHWGRNDAGNFQIWVFEGTKNEIQATAFQFSTIAGLSYSVQEGFGKSRLEVVFPWNQDNLVPPATDKIEKWEYFTNTVEKDWLSAETPSGLSEQLTTIQKQVLRGYERNGPPNPPYNNQAAFEDDNREAFALDTSATPANLLLCYEAFLTLMQGVKSFQVQQPVVRRTTTTSIQYTIAASRINAGHLIRYDTLVAMENPPVALLFQLPNDPDPNSAPITFYGYYKSEPTIQQVALLKWQIVQEWQYGLWSGLIWGEPI